MNNNNREHISITAITYGVDAIAVAVSFFLLVFGCYALTHGNIALGVIISLAILSLLGIGFFEILNIVKNRSFDKTSSESDKVIKSIQFIIREHDHHRINNIDTIHEIRDVINNRNTNH